MWSTETPEMGVFLLYLWASLAISVISQDIHLSATEGLLWCMDKLFRENETDRKYCLYKMQLVDVFIL